MLRQVPALDPDIQGDCHSRRGAGVPAHGLARRVEAAVALVQGVIVTSDGECRDNQAQRDGGQPGQTRTTAEGIQGRDGAQLAVLSTRSVRLP